jgi:uncharacterized small protein (DUF1192 family)
MNPNEIWDDLSSGRIEITDLAPEQLDCLWEHALSQVGAIGAIGRTAVLQTEILRRKSEQSSKNAETLATSALVVSVISALATIVQVWLALCPNR